MEALFKLLAKWPLPLLHACGALLGWLAYLLSPTYRHRFISNSRLAGYSPSQVRAAIAHAGRMVTELPRLWWGAPVPIQWDGMALIDDAHASGNGIVFLTPHLGCFEVTAQAYAQRYISEGKAITVLYRPARKAWLQNLVSQSRIRPGLAAAPATLSGVKTLVKALRSGQALGILPDQVPPLGLGVWSEFFGQSAYSMTLPARLAKQTGACILLAWGERLPSGKGYCVHLRSFSEELSRFCRRICCSNQCIDGELDSRMPRAISLGLCALQAAACRRCAHFSWSIRMMEFLSRLFSHAGVLFMRLIAPLPLPLVRGMGWLLGQLLYLIVLPRRKVVRVNLSLCFPKMPNEERSSLERKVFVRFAQAWLDRSWLWHGSRVQLAKRLHITGDLQALREEPRLVLFSPHFVGLDAGGVAITKEQLRPLCSIYASQRNEVVDEWILQGRQRFGGLRLFARMEGVREIAASVEAGEALYLLPDMDFGTHGAEFVAFFGVNAATVTSLSRFARLCKAKVITLSNRMTPEGYEVNFSSVWSDFPSRDAKADTERMNRELQELVLAAPDQYYWVHKRFKTRPPGEPSVY